MRYSDEQNRKTRNETVQWDGLESKLEMEIKEEKKLDFQPPFIFSFFQCDVKNVYGVLYVRTLPSKS